MTFYKDTNHTFSDLFLIKLIGLSKISFSLYLGYKYSKGLFVIVLYNIYNQSYEYIYIHNDNGSLFINYNGNNQVILRKVNKINKKKISYNKVLKILVKNIRNTLVYKPNIDFIKNIEYPYISFLMGNIYKELSSSYFNKLLKFSFIEDYLTKRNQRDSIDILASTCYIEHAEFECTYCNAGSILPGNINNFYNLGNNFSVDYSYFTPKKKYVYDSYKTFLNQTETIVGGGVNKIEHILSTIDWKKYDYIHVNLCCLPSIIGDDLSSLIKLYQKKIGIPIIYTNQTKFDSYKILSSLIKTYKNSNIKKEKDTCCIVGFPHQKGFVEIVEILDTYGVKVKEIMLPIIEIDSLKSLNEVEKIFLIDTGRNKEAIDIFLSNYSNAIKLDINPYGLNNSIKLIETILSNFNKSLYDNKLISNIRDEYYKLVSTNNYNIGFILFPSHLKYFFHNFRGINMINVLLEMGFNISIFYYIDKNSNMLADIKKYFITNIPKNRIGTIVMSDDLHDLDMFLKDKSIDLYYSEISFDERIIKYKKKYFSASIFEVGPYGSIRTLNNLLRLAKFSKTYFKFFN